MVTSVAIYKEVPETTRASAVFTQEIFFSVSRAGIRLVSRASLQMAILYTIFPSVSKVEHE